jgi:hypothetical protein
VEYAQAVTSPGVRGARVDKGRDPELPYSIELLKLFLLEDSKKGP